MGENKSRKDFFTKTLIFGFCFSIIVHYTLSLHHYWFRINACNVLQEEYNATGNTLVISTVTNATIGLYTCIATNDAGTSQANIILKVTNGKKISVKVLMFWLI